MEKVLTKALSWREEQRRKILRTLASSSDDQKGKERQMCHFEIHGSRYDVESKCVTEKDGRENETKRESRRMGKMRRKRREKEAREEREREGERKQQKEGEKSCVCVRGLNKFRLENTDREKVREHVSSPKSLIRRRHSLRITVTVVSPPRFF